MTSIGAPMNTHIRAELHDHGPVTATSHHGRGRAAALLGGLIGAVLAWAVLIGVGGLGLVIWETVVARGAQVHPDQRIKWIGFPGRRLINT
jgi:hypothetical protein